MNDSDFQTKLNGLLSQIDDLPENAQPQLRELAEETRQRHTRMKKTLAELQESLDHLRMTVKYLVFDLEATRRENKYLRSLVEGESTED
ncbi:MAG: hypothetical protein AAGJ54_03995 [Planctomycetota bacterium]